MPLNELQSLNISQDELGYSSCSESDLRAYLGILQRHLERNPSIDMLEEIDMTSDFIEMKENKEVIR